MRARANQRLVLELAVLMGVHRVLSIVHRMRAEERAGFLGVR
jgi:hypothetical protein